ncbi:hypothetical protein [Candidatus Palauibacter sp.]|uniref:hypothetical protein n=1 Tax=Candidatus Palauibacter sp. TaxID=3101350 RepID=UPI003AF1F5EE
MRRVPGRALWPVLLGSAACTGGFELGAPIADAEEVASRARAASGAEQPTRVEFEWEYADERGSFKGDGVARVNPPDRFRLDLFSTGEGSLQATLVDGDLATSGDLEGVELPPSVFLYAMAGVFRPGDAPPASGFESDDLRVLEFEAGEGRRRYFHLSGDRLTRVEERLGPRRERWIELDWGADPGWPSEAEYRDAVEETGVRWRLVSATAESRPYEERFYVLPNPIRDDDRARRRRGAGGLLQLLRRRRSAQSHAHRLRGADREREYPVRARRVPD